MKQAKWAIFLGIVIFIAAFIYDVLFAGIPYQDPTPEMQSRWDIHSSIAEYIYISGSVIFLAGVLAFTFEYMRNKHQKRETNL